MNEKIKEAPNSKDSEMMVLGSMLTNFNSLSIAAVSLNEEDFYYFEHSSIFSVLKDLYNQDKPADVHLVSEELKRREKLESIGGIAYLTTVAQYAGTAAYIEEYCANLKELSINRKLVIAAEKLRKSSLENPQSIDSIISEFQKEIESISRSSRTNSIINQVPFASDLLDDHESYLDKYRGKEFVGLIQRKLPKLDKLTLGLRGIGLLAAGPNVGKTALTIQLAASVLEENPEACVLFLSLEMRREIILSRFRCYWSELDWDTLTFGSDKRPEAENHFKKEDWDQLLKGNKKIREFGKRLCIVTENDCPNFNASTVKSMITSIKERTGCERIFVVVDYLQVWPEEESRKTRSDLEIDRWRIGQLKTISEFIGDDPILAISETRKPDNKAEGWGLEVADVMGSSRNAYTADMLLLFRSLLNEKGLAHFYTSKEKLRTDEVEKIRKKYEKDQVDLQMLRLPKGRDGMTRGTLFLKFHYRKNTFTEVSPQDIKKELDWIKNKKTSPVESEVETNYYDAFGK